VLKKIAILFNLLNSKSSIRVFNMFLSILSFIYLFTNFSMNLNLLYFSANFIIFIILILIMNIFLAIGWSLLYYDQIKLEIISAWLISSIGKYVPFKIGLISKRFIDSKTYQSEKKFSKYFLIEISYNFGLFFTLSFIGLSNYKISLLILLILLIISLKNILNIRAVISYSFAYVSNLFALVYFYYYSSEFIDFTFSFNYILFSIVGNLFIGAPAGIGIRETMLVNNTYFIDMEIELFTLLILIRLLYVLSDIISFFLGHIFQRYINTPK
jgi:hypothetical protein